MTSTRDIPPLCAALAFSLLLLLPGLAMRSGLMSFDHRFVALLVVSALCIGACVVLGFTRAELGLGAAAVARHWAGGAVITLVLAAFIAIETNFISGYRPQPQWLAFAPFYVLISSPCQEIVCRAIPMLLAERMKMTGRGYVLFSAAIFSLMHWAYGDTLLLANTFVAGLVWASAYLITRNIWPIVASHAAVGTFAFWVGLA
jgi:membrane protease YdiL (CAAX protease family)